jgi:hypothetical protein
MSWPAKVKLTMAQVRFVREAVQAAESMGDCNLHGFDLRFNDYEGAQAFRNRLLVLQRSTTRAYITWNAIGKKLDAAIFAAVSGGSE